jgi:hypothetical protein
MITIDEGGQRLTFDAAWQALKFDDHEHHTKRAMRLQGVIKKHTSKRSDAQSVLNTEQAEHLAAKDETLTERKARDMVISTKAVDVVALCGDQLVLIEIKDFRSNPDENLERWQSPSTGLAVEVPAKVRDSVATLVGALHHDDCCDLWPMARALTGAKAPLVVLMLETGLAPTPSKKNPRSPTHQQVMMGQMKRKLEFLGANVIVVGQDDIHNAPVLKGITVSDLPGATLSP